MMASTPMFKMFFSAVLPLASLACLWFAVLFVYRGVRGLLLRGSAMLSGLHASSALCRHGENGSTRYVPVFTYTTSQGDEVDILGTDDFGTEAEAMQARRPLVYANERPDAAVARNAVFFIVVPCFYLLASVVLACVSHWLLGCMPD